MSQANFKSPLIHYGVLLTGWDERQRHPLPNLPTFIYTCQNPLITETTALEPIPRAARHIREKRITILCTNTQPGETGTYTDARVTPTHVCTAWTSPDDTCKLRAHNVCLSHASSLEGELFAIIYALGFVVYHLSSRISSKIRVMTDSFGAIQELRRLHSSHPCTPQIITQISVLLTYGTQVYADRTPGNKAARVVPQDAHNLPTSAASQQMLQSALERTAMLFEKSLPRDIRIHRYKNAKSYDYNNKLQTIILYPLYRSIGPL